MKSKNDVTTMNGTTHRDGGSGKLSLRREALKALGVQSGVRAGCRTNCSATCPSTRM